MDKYVYSKCANVDINSMECGREKCAPCHSYGPAIRQYCLVHYVESGKGIFEIDGKIHHVSAGQIFYIPPKIITYYEADKNDPWEYKWVGIEGRGVERTFENGGLNKENAVMYVDSALSDIIDELIAAGLNGIEIWHPTCSKENEEKLYNIAKKNKLLMTGGSDFHGMYNHGTWSIGDYVTPKQQLSELLNYKTKIKRQQKKLEALAAEAQG